MARLKDMSGHSKWSTIKRQKGVTDAKRGNLFTKLSNAITIAVREGGGGDPSSNFKLRLAIDKGREANMPKDNIQRAIDKGLGKGGENTLQTAIYEGFAPGNVAVIVETITDNTNRTGGEIRNIFDKNGGRVAAVNYMFTRVGEIVVKGEPDQIFEKALEAGAEDIDDGVIYTRPEDLHKVKEKLETSGLTISEAGLSFKPNKETMVILDETAGHKVMDFIEKIEDLDDVQNVFMNL